MEQLGIDGRLLLTQLFNFAVIAIVLTKFLYKPVLSALDKRQKEIESGLKLKDDMEHAKVKLDEQKKKVLREAQLEGQRIIAASVVEAKKVEETIIKEAKEEANREQVKARASLQVEREKTIEYAKKQALSYAIAISEKLLRSKLTKQEQEALLKDAVNSVTNM